MTYQKRFTTLNFQYFQNMHAKVHLKEIEISDLINQTYTH